jgi:hypothetical protein
LIDIEREGDDEEPIPTEGDTLPEPEQGKVTPTQNGKHYEIPPEKRLLLSGALRMERTLPSCAATNNKKET